MSVIDKKDVPVALAEAGMEAREVTAGPYNVGFERYPKGDYSPYFKGLPHDQCQAEHHGIVLKGKLRYRYSPERADDIGKGQAYYIPPGHTFEVLEDGTEIVEFSPSSKEFEATMDVVGRNMEAAKHADPGPI